MSGNGAGRPRDGESWAALIRSIGNLTPQAAAEYCQSVAGQLKTLGNKVTLKEAVVLRVYAELLSEPSASLLNIFLDRAEGKVADKLEVRDWREQAADAGIDADAVVAEFVRHMQAKTSDKT